jgi:hypothetical protein
MNLFNIIELENEIEQLASENNGEIPEDKFEALIVAQTTAVQKIENICNYVNYLEGIIDQAKKETDRITAIKKRAEKRITDIKAYLTPYVLSKEKVTAGLYTLSIRTSKAVEITDEAKIPKQYMTVKVTESPDKTAIKKAIELGEAVDGANIVENKNLQIK